MELMLWFLNILGADPRVCHLVKDNDLSKLWESTNGPL